MTWNYPDELISALVVLGAAPSSSTPPSVVREYLNDLYRYELRALRSSTRSARSEQAWGPAQKAAYNDRIIALRKKYWPLTVPPRGWGEICRPKGPAVRIALIQRHAAEDQAVNVNEGAEAVRRAAADGAQLVAFAELAFTRFHPQHPVPPGFDVRTLAEPVPGPTTQVFAALARELEIVIVLNVFERDGDKTYDCSPVIDADGRIVGKTRMVHILECPCFHERQYYAPGDLGAPVFDTRVGRVGVAICYDRHFPEYMRALALKGADLVVVPQAGVVDEWAPGVYEGELQTAAMQNGYFVALCNRVGVEERLTFAGESFVCGPDGGIIARAARGADVTLIADVDLSEVGKSHARRVLLKDRRPDLYGGWLNPQT
jgi:N-carbamoylputrescine amidase